MESMKFKVLQLLKENCGRYVSGEALSEGLNVSRTAIWKYIGELRQEGCQIESSTKKGYRLKVLPDIITVEELKDHLDTEIVGSEIVYFNEIDSTNSYGKKMAMEGRGSGMVVIADSQLSGRGRLGRPWSSAAGKGIWMSVVLKPSIRPENVQIITLAASVAVVNALKEATGIRAGIKWPNDIILDGRKVCGILTEMVSEIDEINFLVLGIGINVNHDKSDFEGLLKDKAISLKIFSQEKGACAESFDRTAIVKRTLQELEKVYKKVENGAILEIIDAWRNYSVTLGREVNIRFKDSTITGIAEDITGDGKLLVRSPDGALREVISGEIQVRGMLGYI